MKIMRILGYSSATFLLVTFAAVSLWGQASSGTVVINVVDPAGLAIPGAGVTLTDEATRLQNSRSSNEQGIARFTSVKPSTYTVTVSSAGFRQHL